MLVGRAPDIRSSEVTDKKLYLRRRDFIQVAAMTAVGPPQAPPVSGGPKRYRGRA